MNSLHQQRVAAIRAAIENCGAGPQAEHLCPYLPGLAARELAMRVDDLEPGIYHALMDLNFRRSGTVVYRPECGVCAQCRAIRVRAADFKPDRSQRRCRRRNRGLRVEVTEPELTEEKHALYQRYLQHRHDGQMGQSLDDLRCFLYESPVRTQEVTYRRDGYIVAVGIIDIEPDAVSTVYCYYDPACAADGLGVLNVLWTIAYARSIGAAYVYLGYYVSDCAKMNYKLRYRPCELLAADGTWQRV